MRAGGTINAKKLSTLKGNCANGDLKCKLRAIRVCMHILKDPPATKHAFGKFH